MHGAAARAYLRVMQSVTYTLFQILRKNVAVENYICKADNFFNTCMYEK